MRALKAMFLFGVKPQMLHLNAKQRRLLGLPPKATAEEPLVLPDQLAPVTPSLSPRYPAVWTVCAGCMSDVGRV